jgi:hypothetical protein
MMILPFKTELWKTGKVPISGESVEAGRHGAEAGEGGLELRERSGVLGAPSFFGSDPWLTGRGVDLTVLIAKQAIGRLIAPVIAPPFATGGALLPAMRGEMPLCPFFADRHKGYGNGLFSWGLSIAIAA